MKTRPGERRPASSATGSGSRNSRAIPALSDGCICFDGKPLTIVGVLTPAIEIGNLSAIDIWTPLSLDASAPRDRRSVRVIGRLIPGATLESADAELQPIFAAQTREHAQTNLGWQAHVRSTTSALASGDTWVILGLLGVIVVFVLLIACANLANLVLARLVARRQEQAVRMALGASRWQVIRPVCLESVLLSIAGGLARPGAGPRGPANPESHGHRCLRAHDGDRSTATC